MAEIKPLSFDISIFLRNKKRIVKKLIEIFENWKSKCKFSKNQRKSTLIAILISKFFIFKLIFPDFKKKCNEKAIK